MPASGEPGTQQVEILPLMVVTQAFPARPSALPDVRDFVRRQLTTTPVSDDDIRTLCERVADVLLDAAGESTDIQVSLRIFPDSAEVDVLHSSAREPEPDGTAGVGAVSPLVPRPDRGARIAEQRHRPALSPVAGSLSAGIGQPHLTGTGPSPAQNGPAHPADIAPHAAEKGMSAGSPSFAAWLAARLRAEGMTMEAAARRLEVSTKTISRWVSGTTEPRLRDLYRIRAVFGEPPFH